MCRPDDFPPYEIQDPPEDPRYSDPAYLAWMEQMDAMEELAKQRRLQTPPKRWGAPLPDDPKEGPGYFCEPCWRRGEAEGFHPHAVPPCDPVSRHPGWA